MNKFCSIIFGIIVGGIALLIMLLLDFLFSFSSRSTVYPVFGFCIPALLGYAAYKISFLFFDHIDFGFWRCIADLIDKKRQQNTPVAAPAPQEVSCAQAVSIPEEPEEDCKSNRDHFRRPSFPAIHNGLPLSYCYPNNLLIDINADLLDSIILTKDYAVDILPLDNGGVEVLYNGQRLGVIRNHGDMVSDWITRNEPFICLITSVSVGKEAVGIGFYRDSESKLKSCKNDIARLVRNGSEDMQLSVSCLSDGEMLKFFPDNIEDDGSIPIQSIAGEDVGYLPRKYNKIYENFGIRGVFVDHVDEILDDNCNYKYSAYVRIYWD